MGMHAMSFKEGLFTGSAPVVSGGLQRGLWMSAALLLPLLGVSRPATASLVWQGLALIFGMVGSRVVWAAACQRPREGLAAIFPGQGGGPADPARRRRLPLVTLAFIMTSVALSLALPGTVIDRLCGLHFHHPGLGDLIRVTATHALLHEGYGPLFAAAALLGLAGFYLESREGALRTLGVLLMGSFVTGLIGLNHLLPQGAFSDAGPHLLRYLPAGGTGATAAILGVGTLRRRSGCHAEGDTTGAAAGVCRAIDFLWPLLTALVFLGAFSGYTMPITGPTGMAGYWGLVGGFLSGLALALIWRALEENDMRGETCSPDASARPALSGAERHSAWPCRERLAADGA